MKSKLFIISCLSLTFLLSGCGSSKPNDEKPPETTIEQTTEITTEETTQEISTDTAIEQIKSAISGQVGQNEAITDVVFKDKDLYVYVDFTNVDASKDKEALAEVRFSSITDEILALNIDDLWDTITVDYGDIGHITDDKSTIEESEYGRFFNGSNIHIQK